MGKFFNLMQVFNNYEGTKCQTIVYKQKIVHFIFHKKILIVKNNNFATQKWRILRPGRIAWERLITRKYQEPEPEPLLTWQQHL